MARREVKEAGRAMRQRIEDDSKRHHRPARYAVIKKLHPLTAELTDGSLILDDDDLVLSQWVEQYRKQYGMAVGETLLVHRMHNGDWMATDVISDRKIRRLKTKPKQKPGKGGGGGGGGGEEVEDESPEEGSPELEAEEEAEEEKEAEEDEDAAGAVPKKPELKGFVVHGTNPNVPRPAEIGSVEWQGTVEPVNAIDNDTWINPPSE